MCLKSFWFLHHLTHLITKTILRVLNFAAKCGNLYGQVRTRRFALQNFTSLALISHYVSRLRAKTSHILLPLLVLLTLTKVSVWVSVVCYCLDRNANLRIGWVLLDKWQFFYPFKNDFSPTNHCLSSHYFYMCWHSHCLFVCQPCLLRLAQCDWACRGSESLSWLSIFYWAAH